MLTYIQSISILPPDVDHHLFRGDTLRLLPPTSSSPSSNHLIATTRGAKSTHRGYLSIFPLTLGGEFAEEARVERWQTPTSGGKANAIEIKAKDGDEEGVWIVLTDDEPGAGGIWVLEWNGEGSGGVKVAAEWSGRENDDAVGMDGSSHAVWLD